MRRLIAVAIAGLSVACNERLTGPSGLQTEVRVNANTGWRMSGDAGDRAAGAGTVTFKLGIGEKCVTAHMTLARTAGPSESMTVTVGQSAKTSTVLNQAITVCGKGPIG